MKKRFSSLYIVVFTLLSAAWLYPLWMVLINSVKKKAFISRQPFALPNLRTFAGAVNYRTGIQLTGFPSAFVTSVFITVCSVGLILLCTSMCAWYLSRVRTRWTHALYLLFVFSMIVPFQMVMFTLSRLANLLRLNSPVGIVFIYLGFGAGLAVFMFCGFVRGCPAAVEESALMDGCGPVRLFFHIVWPILQPTAVSVGILQIMWIWNDYLLPYLVLDIRRFRTIPIAVQYLRGGYGSVDLGALMAVLVLSILPVVLFYVLSQRYIVTGVMAGAVKG